MSGNGRPLTVQGDRSILVEVHAEGFAEARDFLALFAELEKSPDYLHTYRITPVSVWNAAALGLSAQDIQETLEEYSCVPVPKNVLTDIEQWIALAREIWQISELIKGGYDNFGHLQHPGPLDREVAVSNCRRQFFADTVLHENAACAQQIVRFPTRLQILARARIQQRIAEPFDIPRQHIVEGTFS